MIRRFLIATAMLGALPALSACGPAIGAGAIVAADEVVEEENNDEGLF